MSGRKDIQPYWRPNFKIQSTLPDIKVVRTDFMVNFIAVALVLVVAFTLLQREYRAYSLRSSIAGLEQRIQALDAGDGLNLKKSEGFRELARSIEEVQHFFRAPLAAHELLAELSVLKPEGLVFSRVQLTEAIGKKKGKGKAAKAQMVYKINITGDVRALTILTQFKGKLQGSPTLNPEGFEAVVDESMKQRDANTGIIPFQVSISLMPEANSTPSKGGKG